jgi:predicted nucleic acid-binding protein
VSVYVIDASVAIKWFVPEIHSDAARRLLAGAHQFLAPDLLFAEAGNAIWKKVRRRELTADEAQRLVGDLATVAVDIISTRVLVGDAAALAVTTGVTVYDALYLALAVRLETQVITADDKFRRALSPYPMAAAHVRLIQTFTE